MNFRASSTIDIGKLPNFTMLQASRLEFKTSLMGHGTEDSKKILRFSREAL